MTDEFNKLYISQLPLRQRAEARSLLNYLLDKREIEARLNEVVAFDTHRHYGKDYQDSFDELDDYKYKRVAELEQQLKSLEEK